MYYLKENLMYIPREWNFIDPPLESEEMEGYLYHFTGWYHEKYKKLINTYKNGKSSNINNSNIKI